MEATSVINELNKPIELEDPLDLNLVSLSLCAETKDGAESWVEAIMRFHNCKVEGVSDEKMQSDFELKNEKDILE